MDSANGSHFPCSVTVQGPWKETGPGIRVRGRLRPCGKPARWLATWTELDPVTDKPVTQQNVACDEHHERLTMGGEPSLDHYGSPTKVTWAPIAGARV